MERPLILRVSCIDGHVEVHRWSSRRRGGELTQSAIEHRRLYGGLTKVYFSILKGAANFKGGGTEKVMNLEKGFTPRDNRATQWEVQRK